MRSARSELEICRRERAVVAERAAHVREVLSGYRAGTAELAGAGEPRAGYGPGTSLTERYQANGDQQILIAICRLAYYLDDPAARSTTTVAAPPSAQHD